MARPTIPLFVITGAQGSGKTAAINRWLRLPGLARTLVVLQQDGGQALEHDLVAHCAGGVLRRGFSCACCGPLADLPRTLQDVPWRFAREGRRLFDRIWIETAGDADPLEVARVVQAQPKLARQYRPAGVIGVLGRQALSSAADASLPIWRQAEAADLLLLPPHEKADAGAYAALLDHLRQLPDSARRRLLPAGPSSDALVARFFRESEGSPA